MADVELSIRIRARDASSRAFKSAQKSAKSLGRALTKVGKVAAKAGAAGLVALGVAALKFGSDFQSAFKTIRVGTGATGDALAGLNDDFKAVLRTGPEGMDVVAKSISTLSTLTGEAGNSLRAMSRNALDASRIMGEDAGPLMDEAGKAIKRMNLEGRDATSFFDKLFVASQQTNVPMQKLATTLNAYGPVLTNLGLGIDNQIAIFGHLTAAGLEVSRVMPGINAFMRKLADEGVTDLGQAFEDTLGTIAGAGSASEALKIATEAFGAEGAQRLSVAVRTGALDIADFAFQLSQAEGAIGKTAKETRTWQENLGILKNKVLVKMEPLLTGMIDKLTEFTEWLSSEGIPLAEDFGAIMLQEFQPAIDAVRDAFNSLAPKLREVFDRVKEILPVFKNNEDTMRNAAFIIGSLLVGAVVVLTIAILAWVASMLLAAAPFILIGLAIAALIIGIGLLIKNWETVSAFFDKHLSFLKDIFEGAFEIIKGNIKLFVDLVTDIIKIATAIWKGDWSAVWEGIKSLVLNLGRNIWSIIKGWIKLVTVIFNGLRALWGPIWERVKTIIVDKVTDIKDGIVRKFNQVVTFVKGLGPRLLQAGRSVMESLAKGLKAGLNIAIGAIERGFNALLGGIRKAIRKVGEGLNFLPGNPGQLAIDFADSLQNIKIPRLAHGGIARRPTLAMIGEAGPEAVIPLSRAGAVAPLAAQGSGDGGTTIVFEAGAFQGPFLGNEFEARRFAEQVAERIRRHRGAA